MWRGRPRTWGSRALRSTMGRRANALGQAGRFLRAAFRSTHHSARRYRSFCFSDLDAEARPFERVSSRAIVRSGSSTSAEGEFVLADS